MTDKKSVAVQSPAPSVSGSAGKVIELFERSRREVRRSGEVPLTVGRPATADATEQVKTASLDLTGRPKLIMLCGPGRTGKSTLARWLVERALSKEGSDVALATLDAERPTLPLYFPSCMRPDSAEGAPGFFELLLQALLAEPVTTILDFQADGTLAFLLREQGGKWLMDLFEQGGISPVMLYTLSSRVADLTVANTHLEMGFTPAATAMVLNNGTVEGRGSFNAIREHSVFRKLIEAGAECVTMPRLIPADVVEELQPMSFTDAERIESGLDTFTRSRVWGWRHQMDKTFSGIRTWLP